jgi:hypothetical protein
MTTIDDDIESTDVTLSDLRDTREDLILNIRKYIYFDREDGDVSYKEKVTGALYYLFRKSIRSYFDDYFRVHKWDFKLCYLSHIPKYKDNTGITHPIFAGELVLISHVLEWNEMWRHAIANDMEIIGLEDYKNKIATNNSELISAIRKYYGKRLTILNCSDLFIKDMYIITPKINPNGY